MKRVFHGTYQSTIRAIEQGKDVKFSDLQCVAAALGLKLELISRSRDALPWRP
jgi:hypothetical protein